VIVVSSPSAPPYVPPPRPVNFAVAVTGSGEVTGKAVGSDATIACGAGSLRCFETVKPGTSVSLHAAAAAGFRFRGWSGACKGSVSTCQVKVSVASDASARFTAVAATTIIPIEIKAAAFAVRWQASVATGRLLIRGKITKSAAIVVQLRRSSGASLLVEHLAVPAGSFSLTLKLNSGLRLLPGGFVVAITGKSGRLTVSPQVKTLSLPGPPEGVVESAYASASATGGPASALHTVKGAFVRFTFQTVPATNHKLTIAWYLPSGRLVGTVTRLPRHTIIGFVKSSAPLPKGVWRIDLRFGHILVKQLQIPIT
jgi:hypothetical protein